MNTQEFKGKTQKNKLRVSQGTGMSKQFKTELKTSHKTTPWKRNGFLPHEVKTLSYFKTDILTAFWKFHKYIEN